MLRRLDRQAWVIDPERPTGRDLHRTVVVKPGITVLVTVVDTDDADDLDSSPLPELRLMGPEAAVGPLRDRLVANVEQYDPDYGLFRNLERILEVELPRREDAEASRVDFNVDCCICYSIHLGVEDSTRADLDLNLVPLLSRPGASLPDRSCQNVRCGKRFHCECLFEYLQSNVENVRSLGHVHGNCPYCDAKISCREPTT